MAARFLDRHELKGKAKLSAMRASWGMAMGQEPTEYIQFLQRPGPLLCVPMFVQNMARREMRRRKMLNS